MVMVHGIEAAGSAISGYIGQLKRESEFVYDAATGEKVETATRLIYIEAVGDAVGRQAPLVSDCRSLLRCIWDEGPSAVLCIAIFAPAGTGKSWMMIQLQWLCSSAESALSLRWTPIFIPVVDISNALLQACAVADQDELVQKAERMLTVEWLLGLVSQRLTSCVAGVGWPLCRLRMP